MVTLALVVAALGSRAEAEQLTLSWVDNSAGTASSRIERKAGTGGIYAELTTQPPGVTSYTDTAVAAGMTYCYRVQAYNTAGTSPFSNEDCSTIVASTLGVTVALAGTGIGVVSSSPIGIACGTDCTETYPSGTAVTLTATPAWGSVFQGWSGGGCSGTGLCTVTGNVAVTVTASFSTVATYALTVSRTGSGTVTSSPAGISCGTDCSESYASGTAVTLAAAPAAGNVFTGWSGGGCSGTGTCTVSVTSAQTVSATFAASTYTLTVGISGTGSVTSSPAGINCPASTCSGSYPMGTATTLTATPAAGKAFTGWSGGGCSGTGTCTVSGTSSATVTATFTTLTTSYTLTVNRTGSGTVTSSPAGISCGADCSESYASGTAVTLAAAPAAGNVFTGWSGGGCSGTGTCTVSVTGALSVSATFAAAPTSSTSTLTVDRAGPGSVSGAGIACGSDCSETYPSGAVVTLTAVPGKNAVFTGWSGGCSGTGTCVVALTQSTTVKATFKRGR